MDDEELDELFLLLWHLHDPNFWWKALYVN